MKHRFVALMPQWDFLDFVSSEACRYPTFALRMECEAVGLAEEGGRISGVTTKEGEHISARLVIAADGRSSLLRKAAELPLHDLGAPIDVFWFRVPKQDSGDNRTMGIFDTGTVIAVIDRGDYWQCAFVFAKGSADAVRGKGIDAFRARVANAVPELAGGIHAVQSWDDVKLLSVSLDRLILWHRPGLLAIGDAAHAMSPVGGVGINLAIQDAVAAANILAAPFAAGSPVDALLGKVQQRRMLPTKIIQGLQRAIHRRILGRALFDQKPMDGAALPIRLMDRLPILQQIPARLVGLGIRREHIRSPEAVLPGLELA
jgi:2-polyprenyl-6-methoxyphenol hydroxylase-like FAD-dependent oxidoreductase